MCGLELCCGTRAGPWIPHKLEVSKKANKKEQGHDSNLKTLFREGTLITAGLEHHPLEHC